MQKVYFHYADRKLTIAGKNKIKQTVEFLFRKEKLKLDKLNYVFCSDEYLLQINNQFLNHDFYTDIITFDLSETNKTIGEIYISLDRVKDNAIQRGVFFKEELLRVLFHGALHLCGYKDKKKTEIKIMRAKENYYIKAFHLIKKFPVEHLKG
ncbi:rRNA maturation RNase YbeY [Panacibacter ginsenosidivorans]|uniref:Endoribonuclease YbeY n=1 Tax=Panacibacter ginsenosidivorans TaxID=1813871 RepID=A0A5B8VGK3_9BACT|nr:rRNA maturation RNase YbeY [Panacibacter ginsenosidivorans]